MILSKNILFAKTRYINYNRKEEREIEREQERGIQRE